jgi:integrase
MMHYNELAPAQASALVPHADRLRLAAAAYLARFKGTSREHASSDLRCYLAWCGERGLDPFLARRPHLELYLRWMQEVRRFKPSTVSRRFSVTAGFYRTCVIDGVLDHSPAEYVRRPAAPAESPTLGFTHLQFEALLTAARRADGAVLRGSRNRLRGGRPVERLPVVRENRDVIERRGIVWLSTYHTSRQTLQTRTGSSASCGKPASATPSRWQHR